MISKKKLKLSHVTRERAVMFLNPVSRFSVTATVLQEMAQIMVVVKLCLLLQVECGVKTKERA